ncbi:hypothetical protein F4861DRAFT_534680 [Xylaria intraflava]|nr:hypothetical protein F4861DRAFT_534680 [Xylaria intraflava]
MASDPTTEPSQFTLQLLSPSVNVPQPLVFENLPITTTVGQLKGRIRDCLSTKPPDNAQRLIHRGRLLARDTETMLELFGQDSLRSPDRQTLHLVLRDLSDGQTPTPPPPFVQQPGSRSQTPGHQHPRHNQPHIRIGIGGPPHPNIAFGFPQAAAPNGPLNGAQLPPGWTPQHALQNQLQMMARLGPANQPQPSRHNSMAHYATQNPGVPGSTTPGRTGSPSQPESARGIVREAIGPNGQRWRFGVNETLVASTQTTTQRPGGAATPFSLPEAHIPTLPQPYSMLNPGPTEAGYDAQIALRTADVGSATRVMADAMRRNASSSSPVNLTTHQGQQPIRPGVTTPLIASRRGTPGPMANTRLENQRSIIPEVYILSSPTGPRAVLLNGNLGTYYSAQPPSFPSTGHPFSSISYSINVGNTAYALHGSLPQIVRRAPVAGSNVTNPHRNYLPPDQQPQLQQQHGLQLPNPMQPQLGHGIDNAQVGVIRLAQIWPHIWMILRLAGFIWWFTSPTSSWLRWITVVSIAITLFIINTGVMHPLAEQIWVPLRRHLENLIPPAADADARQQQRPAAGAENIQGGDAIVRNPVDPGHPNPSDAAARLVQQRHQDNANWLLNQVRRLERAGILFIASLAPGLAERHIAQAEAQASERQRQQEAEAAAAAAAQAASEDTNGTTNVASRETHETPDDEGLAHEARPSPNGGAE